MAISDSFSTYFWIIDVFPTLYLSFVNYLRAVTKYDNFEDVVLLRNLLSLLHFITKYYM